MTNYDVNKFCADKLKSFRTSKHLTQKELAEDLNITQQQIARYENNLRQFKQDFLFKLSEYFNVSINDFFPPIKIENNDDSSNEQTSEIDQLLFSKIKELDEEEKKAVLQVMKAIHKDDK